MASRRARESDPLSGRYGRILPRHELWASTGADLHQILAHAIINWPCNWCRIPFFRHFPGGYLFRPVDRGGEPE